VEEEAKYNANLVINWTYAEESGHFFESALRAESIRSSLLRLMLQFISTVESVWILWETVSVFPVFLLLEILRLISLYYVSVGVGCVQCVAPSVSNTTRLVRVSTSNKTRIPFHPRCTHREVGVIFMWLDQPPTFSLLKLLIELAELHPGLQTCWMCCLTLRAYTSKPLQAG
jgi:hypothetical protein